MGIFINNGDHPDVYKNNGELIEANQSYWRLDYLNRLLQDQYEGNIKLYNSLENIKSIENTRSKQLDTVDKKLTELKTNYLQQQQIGTDVVQQLVRMEKSDFVQQDQIRSLAIREDEVLLKIEKISNSNQEMTRNLEKYQILFNSLMEGIANLSKLQQQTLQVLANHEEIYYSLFEKLESHSNDTLNRLVAQENIQTMLLAEFESQGKELVERFTGQENTQSEILQNIQDQATVQQNLQKHLVAHENMDSMINERLDNQEALTEKLLRQVTHLRTILFERTSYLSELIENSYKKTSTYLSNLLSGTKEPFTFQLLPSSKDKDKDNNNE
ncbi:hypothetical protein OEV98_03190 [Caldibacillus lycopersici]|uniref:Uncharacterized protein n=1 Tax=Perspicuibacillus lycopersici TaxID=1325689 RepID=A0AAE3LMC8_9BACI|nr:hypothetical protein [Perspicuibacillus lycopersici]MCU9612567.1 hypothetical protein [Perspicuibacillus lycopersici]